MSHASPTLNSAAFRYPYVYRLYIPFFIRVRAFKGLHSRKKNSLFLLLGLLLAGLAGCASNQPLEINNHPLNLKGLSYRQATIVTTANKMLGVPYRWGGNTANGGLDCSGLADLSYHAAGLSLPRTSNEQYHAVPRVKVAQPGDLLFFGHGSTATHVGIYMGLNLMIHAPGSGRTVEYAHLNYPYWKEHFIGAGSFTH